MQVIICPCQSRTPKLFVPAKVELQEFKEYLCHNREYFLRSLVLVVTLNTLAILLASKIAFLGFMGPYSVRDRTGVGYMQVMYLFPVLSLQPGDILEKRQNHVFFLQFSTHTFCQKYLRKNMKNKIPFSK